MENSKNISGHMKEISEDGRLQFPCAACGATLSFQAGQTSLACEHCGHKEDIVSSQEGVEEHAFEKYTKPQTADWGTATQQFDCKTCGAKTTVEAKVTSFSCPFCGSNQVEVIQASKRMRPESLIPFAIDKKDAGKRFQDWIQRAWFRPDGFKKLARLERIYGVYLPHWTFDAMTESSWQAEAGHHYDDYEVYTDAQGQTQKRSVRKTRWEWVKGKHSAFFNDVLVPATDTVDANLIAGIYPFSTEKLVAYDPRYLAGWAAEDYKLEMPACWPSAKAYIDGQIQSACAGKIGGDTHRNLTVWTSYFNQTYKLCLLPVWVSSYRYNNKLYSCLINGQTGQVAGTAPCSWLKVSLTVLFIVSLVTAIIMLLSR